MLHTNANLFSSRTETLENVKFAKQTLGNQRSDKK